MREADEEDLVGETSFVVYRHRILDVELLTVRHTRGCFGCLVRLI